MNRMNTYKNLLFFLKSFYSWWRCRLSSASVSISFDFLNVCSIPSSPSTNVTFYYYRYLLSVHSYQCFDRSDPNYGFLSTADYKATIWFGIHRFLGRHGVHVIAFYIAFDVDIRSPRWRRTCPSSHNIIYSISSAVSYLWFCLLNLFLTWILYISHIIPFLVTSFLR